ncbi:MAG: ImmA/IrrE family metallo-endopeptidase [Bacteroidota bacterium]
MTRVDIPPDMLRWAMQRANIEVEDLLNRFPKIHEWMSGEVKPTLKQIEKFAKAVHVPVGFLFLPEAPKVELPIPDFRTFRNRDVGDPSPNLLEVIYNCEQRQAWYREFAQIAQEKPRSFIGRANLRMDPKDVANDIRVSIGFDLDARRQARTWEDALRMFIRQIDDAGILIMISGIVQSNTHRKLDLEEFRGFALSDILAPLIFINGVDSKSGQMFTLAHELAHLWLNESGVSNASAKPLNGYDETEVWCNAVAAELLVPLDIFMSDLRENEDWQKAMRRLSRYYKVSTLVILRRLFDAKWFNKKVFEEAWEVETNRLKKINDKRGPGGNFYRGTVARVSRRFTQALVVSTLEGQTLYRDAFRMLGVKKTETFNNLGREVGVIL